MISMTTPQSMALLPTAFRYVFTWQSGTLACTSAIFKISEATHINQKDRRVVQEKSKCQDGGPFA